MPGKANRTSSPDEMKASSAPPRQAAATASSAPAIMLPRTTASGPSIDVRAPTISRDSTSRPSKSYPSR